MNRRRGRPRKATTPVSPRSNQQCFKDLMWAFVWKRVRLGQRAEIINEAAAATEVPLLERYLDGNTPDSLINFAMEEFYGAAVRVMRQFPVSVTPFACTEGPS